MFLEKFSRFARVYNLYLNPRHKTADSLPLTSNDGSYSIQDALRRRIDADNAFEIAPNGDTVELVDVSYDTTRKCLVLLFHRASPDAADPAYRRKVKERTGKKITIRRPRKEEDEHQSVSAHMVIKDQKTGKGAYGCALEEIPGLSLSTIQPIITVALRDYEYSFKRRGKDQNTHTTVRAQGVKSETLENALQNGQIGFVKLVRPADAPFVDASGVFQPINETMRLRVRGDIDGKSWRDTVGDFLQGAKAAGWEDFSVDIEFNDRRRKTVKVERDAEAKEILFVRSEHIVVKKELAPCTETILSEIVTKFENLL